MKYVDTGFFHALFVSLPMMVYLAAPQVSLLSGEVPDEVQDVTKVARRY